MIPAITSLTRSILIRKTYTRYRIRQVGIVFFQNLTPFADPNPSPLIPTPDAFSSNFASSTNAGPHTQTAPKNSILRLTPLLIARCTFNPVAIAPPVEVVLVVGVP